MAAGRAPPPASDVDVAIINVEPSVYRDGYAEGFEAGEADGRKDAQQRMQILEGEACQQSEAIRQGLASERGRLSALVNGLAMALQGHERAMEELAFEVALASLARALGQMSEDGQLMQRLCAQMTEEFRTKAIRLCVSTTDRPTLPDQLDGLEILADPAMAQGECSVVTERGQLKSSIAMRLGVIHEAMLDALGAGRP